jgi:hypothetical protein
MNFALKFIIGRQLALNQGVTTQQATSDGLLAAVIRQPIGLLLSVFLARNQTSTATNPNTTANVPGAPAIASATAGDAQVTVTITPPALDGGSPIIAYTVTPNPADGGVDSNAGTTSLSHTVTGLSNGKPYTFTATATNAAGKGAPSQPSASVTPSASAEAGVGVGDNRRRDDSEPVSTAGREATAQRHRP